MQQLLESGYCPETAVEPLVAVVEPTFTISDLAREFSVTLRALRFYESRGLLNPRRQGRVRIYRQGDRVRLALILRGKKLGFALNDIHRMLTAEPNGAMQTALHLSREKCVEQINLLESRKRQIETALAELRLAYASRGQPAPRRPELQTI